MERTANKAMLGADNLLWTWLFSMYQ